MTTLLRIGPADHGRSIAYEDYAAAAWADGYQYELIDGRLYVSPQANLSEGRVEKWIYGKLDRYSSRRPNVINFVYNKARVFVPDRLGITNPEPDVAAYHAFPLDIPFRELKWEDIFPILVVEVLSPDDPEKDLVRNVELYLRVPSIKEYWLLDTRENPDEPKMRVHRRSGKRWKTIDLSYGEMYQTKLLPGFRLILDPRG
jgi:Uma2 family endonuclease